MISRLFFFCCISYTRLLAVIPHCMNAPADRRSPLFRCRHDLRSAPACTVQPARAAERRGRSCGRPVMPSPPFCFDQEHLKAQTTGPETERGAETAPAPVRNATVCTAVFPPGPRSAGSFRNSRPLICRPFASAQAQQWLRLPQAPAGSNPGRPSQDTHQGIDGRCRDPRDAALHQHNAYRFQR